MVSDNKPLLDEINFPADLRKLSKDKLTDLADELRKETVDAVSVTGGHLGASLGVIEFTVELEIVFEPCIVPYISVLTTLLALTFALTVTNEG